ncbi:MAG: GMC family oxidoreductase [Burkholderiales bacterium]|nr:GMC family oxidoreductase [Burkholderiales bacterium]OJX08333.1 MAG: GMC family oxidoreductase [Burkholderiales bacterium 70-64]
MSSFPDSIAAGLARGWKVLDAGAASHPARIECDVAIVGSGAGGGITAEVLARAGLRVVVIEEGPLKSSRDFEMREADAYPQLYQESAARKTKDKAINIMQGRCVGGSTTVNWTSSFRTPEPTLAWWRAHYGLADFTAEALLPWFEQAERRLSIGPWGVAPNENNSLLRRGAARLGIPVAGIRRNVRGCFDLGYCGMGCPTNAKQSMLVTTLPAALEAGAMLLTRARATRFAIVGDRIEALEVDWLDASGLRPGGARTRVQAQHYVLAAGAINGPALLLRSQAPDPHGLLGARTFLHPVVVSAASFAQRVDGYAGAPQTLYTDHFLETQPIDGPVGYKLEAPPIHPVLFATTLQGFGAVHAERMKDFAHTHALIALMRDGFHPQAPGGRVELRGDGSPVLDYPLTDYLLDGARRALLSMAEIQFEAGARIVYPVHELAEGYRDLAAARAAIAALPMQPLLVRVVSAHVMGGCPMAADAQRGVVRPDGVHWQLANLSVHDGSIFPTSIGANPQLSIYGITARMASGLARTLTGRPAPELAQGGAPAQ